MKIILPLVALVLLSTLFLISGKVDPTSEMPVAQVDLEQKARDQGVTNPNFSGVASGGETINFQAEMVRPDPEDKTRLNADQVKADIILNNGTTLQVTSARGHSNQALTKLELSGDVQVVTSTGYDIRSEHVLAQLDTLYAEAPGVVSGTGPLGELNAGRMQLTSDEVTGQMHLLFTQGVKLIYKPMKSKE